MSTTTKKKSGKKSVFIIIGIVLAVFIIAIIGISAVLNNLIKNAGLTVDAAHPVYQDISSDVTTSGTNHIQCQYHYLHRCDQCNDQ